MTSNSVGFYGRWGKCLIAAVMVLTLGSYGVSFYTNSNGYVRDVRKDEEAIRQAVRAYHSLKIDYSKNLIDYKPFESFLHFEDTAYFTKPNFRQDDEGIPLVKYGTMFYYNPVTVAQYALYLFGKYHQKKSDLKLFIRAVDKLLALQAPDGSFRFSFPWRYYLTGQEFKPGWVSAMAQGQALSVFARAYRMTKDLRYLKAGEKALCFLLMPVSKGGVMNTLGDLNPHWKHYLTFEQYPVKPASYTLNGFMFTVLGCFDWWQLDPGAPDGSCKMALTAFAEGVESLCLIIKYYDVGGFGAYDLGHIVYQTKPNLDPFYFAVDIYLLHVLHGITGNDILGKYEKLWASYVNE